VIIVNGSGANARLAESSDLPNASLLSVTYLAETDISSVFMQPDAGAPGMNLAVQFIGDALSESAIITTNSSDIVVGPNLVTDANGDKVTSGGNVLTTIFFISQTASAQTVEISYNGQALTRTFEIVIPAANSGDFTGQGAGPHPLGNGDGRNGTRTVGGTIVLESLLIPTGVVTIVHVNDCIFS